MKNDVYSSPASSRDRPLRVLQVVESSAGGTGRHVLDLSAGLIDRGCDVHLVYSDARADQTFLARLERLPGLRAELIPMRSSIHPSDLLSARRVRKYIRAHGPFDVVHGHSSKGGAIARIASIGCGADVFYTMHGLVVIDPGLPRVKRAIYLLAEHGLGLRTTRIVAVGPEESRQAVRLGLGRNKVVTIANGVDAPTGRSRAATRQALGLDDDEVAIGFVGRLVEQKAADVLLRAFAQASPDLPLARLLMIGDGPLAPALKALAEQLGIGERVRWLGERDARDYFAAMDVFAISSRKEGLPYVVLEAMAAGLPVLATRSAGVESLVIAGVNGIVVAPDDVTAFSLGLYKLVADARHRAAMGRGSLQRIKLFSVDAMVSQTLEMYANPRTFGIAARRPRRTLSGEAIAVAP